MIKTIEKKIYEKYPTKVAFAEKIGIKRTDLSRKLKAFDNKFNWCESFLSDLDCEIKIHKK